jgi:hypothetical protein
MSQLGVSQHSTGADWEKNLLGEGATPELYRQNAFRLLGLPIGSTQPEIKRHVERSLMAAKHGYVRWSRFDGHEILLAESSNRYEKICSK